MYITEYILNIALNYERLSDQQCKNFEKQFK